jgi:hypothetical protein
MKKYCPVRARPLVTKALCISQSRACRSLSYKAAIFCICVEHWGRRRLVIATRAGHKRRYARTCRDNWIVALTEKSEIASFVSSYIPTVAALELLLLLRSDPHRQWRSSELVSELRASTDLVEKFLRHFKKHGLATNGEGRWQFSAAEPKLDALSSQLSEMYRTRPMHVISLIAWTGAAHH